MADTRGSVGRGRPRGAAKIKVATTSHANAKGSASSSGQGVSLPKLKPSGSNNNQVNSHDQLAPFSPRAKQIPVGLPLAPHPPSLNAKPPPLSLRQAVAEPSGPSSFEPSLAKTAWSTPRSPVPETSDPSALSPSSSALETFFHADGAAVSTPGRLLATEESLLATEQLYAIDWTALQADADKFLEISATATQHLESLQTEIPAVTATSLQTKAALTDLSRDVETLHDQHKMEREQMRQDFDCMFTQQTDERLAMMEAHVAERAALELAHDSEIAELKTDFQQQISELEQQSATLEKNCLDQIEALKQRMAHELEMQQEKASAELQQHEEKASAELEELRTRTDVERERFERGSQAAIEELRAKSEQEMAEYRSSSEAAYEQLQTSLQREISDLKTASAQEIERLLEASASTLAEVTDKLTTELKETQDTAAAEIARLKTEHAAQQANLERDNTSQVAELRQRHEEEVCRLESELRRRVRELNGEIATAKNDHVTEVEQLTTRFTAELTTATTTLAAENATLVKSHVAQVSQLEANHEAKLESTVTAYESQLAMLHQSHSEQLQTLQSETVAARETMVQQHGAQLRSLQEDAKRECDRLVLRYESDLEFLRRATAEQLEKNAKERDETIQQLREAHAARVLALETGMREADKRYQEEARQLTRRLETSVHRIGILEASEQALKTERWLILERAGEERSRFDMRLDETMAAITSLETAGATKDATIDKLKKELRVSEEDRHMKSNTILELTFVIKSRDEEIEKLHAALLDTIQNVNTKTEILELTAETLSSKAKELEDAKAALRLESGRLSMVEEDVHHKAVMLEDSELKIENMRLQMETLRLEMKRLQMDMKLQHEHSSGEMELKQGEIRRLHAAQTELKQKNDIHQETIARLESSLASSQRQGDETRRRMELLKVETAQYLEDARKLGDQLLEKEKENTVLTKDKQLLHSERQRLQIQLSNLQSVEQRQRERIEGGVMLVEDIHCQYQRRMEMTAAEKDERLRHEKHLMLLEIGALKDSLKRLESVEAALTDSQALVNSLRASLAEVNEEKAILEGQINALVAQMASQEATFTGDRAVLEEKQRLTQGEVDAKALRVGELELLVEQAERELREKEATMAAVSSDASSLSGVLRDKENEIAATQQRLEAAQEECARLEASLSAQRQQIEEAHNNITKQREELTQLQEKLTACELVCTERDAEIAALEDAVERASTAHLNDLRDAEDHLQHVAHGYEERVGELEAAVKKEESSKAMISQAHGEANLQLQYLVKTLKREEDAHVVTRSQLKQVMIELQQAQEDANRAIGSALAEAKQARESEVNALKSELDAVRNELEAAKIELETLAANHATRLLQLEEEQQQAMAVLNESHQQALAAVQASSSQSAEAVREELTQALSLAQEAAQRERADAVASLQEEHAKMTADAEAAYQAQLTETESRVSEAVAERSRLETLLEESRLDCERLGEEVGLLQQRIAEKDKAIAESEEVSRVRKATMESVRKEMLLLMDMQRQQTHSRQNADIAEDGSDTPAGNDNEKETTDSAGGGGGRGGAVIRVGPMLSLIRQQLETFVSEDLHTELPSDFELRDEADLLSTLKDLMRVRHFTGTSTRSRGVLSVDEVCSALGVLQQIASLSTDSGDLSAMSLPAIEATTRQKLLQYTELQQQVGKLVKVEAGDGLSHEELLSVLGLYETTMDEKLRQHADLQTQLCELLEVDAANASVKGLQDVLEAYAPALTRLRDLDYCSSSDETENIHAMRSAAFLAALDTRKLLKQSQEQLLEAASASLETEDLHSLEDLLPVLKEAAWLRGVVTAHLQSKVAEPSPDEASNMLMSQQVSSLLDERRAFIAEISHALEWPESQLQQPQQFLSVHLADAVRELMLVIHAFESLSSSARRREAEESPLAVRAQSIVAFADELKLISQFAQTILEEEADATAVNDQSHTSSSSSLLSVREMLTRTPTPTMNIPPAETEDTIGDLDESHHELLLLSDDALAPMHDAHTHNENEDADKSLKPSLSGALSESLLDISLVMSDHHRILSEAAHWVTKAHNMSPRHKKEAQKAEQSSLDFAAELTQLVRDHCALLSLSRKLFRLQDPRHDLPSVLQCLAVLSRLTGRLAFFNSSARIQASDSSESLRSDTSDSSQHHQRLKASLSVFASMEDVARHLQDYDTLLSRLTALINVPSDEIGSLDNVETLGDVIAQRLGLFEQLRGMLGLTDPVVELPAFVAFLQNTVKAPGLDEHGEEAIEELLGVDAIQNCVQRAVEDSGRLKEMLAQMREELPFAASSESPHELMQRLQETLAQCETLLQEKQDAQTRAQELEERLETEMKLREDEDAVLQGGLEASQDDGEAVERLDRLRLLVGELTELRRQNAEMQASIAEEETLLHSDSGDDRELASRVEAVRELVQAKDSLEKLTKELKDEVSHNAKQLEDERQELQVALANEKQFLTNHGVVWGDDEPRQAVYERFLRDLAAARERQAREHSEVATEAAFLQQHKLPFGSESEAFASRMAVYKTLLDAQHTWIEDKMERELQEQQERALLEREGIEVTGGREQVVTRFIETVHELKKAREEFAAERELSKTRVDEEMARERGFLTAHGLENQLESGRVSVYETLLERVETAKQAMIAWTDSPHGNARGCVEAEAQHQEELVKMAHERDQATTEAIKAALAKQAEQFEFRRAATGDNTPGTGVSETKIAQLLEAFTQRDNAAIRTIYRLIRLATDILNTSTFSRSSALPGTGGEIPVELTQSVMTCTKELKALKEFLLESLGQISKDYAFVSTTQELLSREQLTDKETAVDFALLLHREYSASVNRKLVEKTQAIDTTVETLRQSLATHSGVFSDAEAKMMAMEMQVASEVAARQAMEASCVAKEEFVQQFSAERKQIEAALQTALQEAKREREELVRKVEALDAERYEALALANAVTNGFTATPMLMTPRTPLTASVRTANGAFTPSVVVPMRPDKPRELTSSRLKTGTGTAHKERFVSDLEKETGQRRSTNTAGGSTQQQPPMSARKANEWKRHELLSSSMQIEQQFRAMNETSGGHNFMAISPGRPTSTSNASQPTVDRSSLADQELWYQGVRLVAHISFFVSVFFVPKQKTFRVEVFNSDTEQQQTIYVTIDEMQGFVSESKRAARHGISLDDPTRHSDVVDVLFERVKVLGGGDSNNVLFAFQ